MAVLYNFSMFVILSSALKNRKVYHVISISNYLTQLTQLPGKDYRRKTIRMDSVSSDNSQKSWRLVRNMVNTAR